jgi:hypothetical protein
VWEFVNSYFGEGLGFLSALPPTNSVFRAFRYSKEQIERAKRTNS